MYEAEQRMGEGTRLVAIKTLLPELSNDHTLVSRFHRESGTVAQLEHPNTIRFYDYGETPDGVLYIVMELVTGQALTDLIEQGPIALPRALRILKQVCGALHEAHELGIVHRDLKPDNIVLTTRAGEEDFVKLLDFGIAAHVGPDAATRTKLTQQGMVLGTPPYMSPEQLAGEELGPASDVYSLGVIAYEMLTGHLPFEADTPWLWAHKHMTEPPRPMETFEAGRQLPGSVRLAVLHALEKSPGQRPSSTLRFYHELSSGRTADMPDTARTEPGHDEAPNTSPMPALPVGVSAGTQPEGPASPAFHTASALAAPVAPRPPRRRHSRRGWLVAASVLVGAGALAAGLVVLRDSRTTPNPPVRGAGGMTSTASSGATEIAPLVDSTPAPEPTLTSGPEPPPPVKKTLAPPHKQSPTPPKPTPAPTPAPTPTPTQPSATASRPPTFPTITLPNLPLPTRPRTPPTHRHAARAAEASRPDRRRGMRAGQLAGNRGEHRVGGGDVPALPEHGWQLERAAHGARAHPHQRSGSGRKPGLHRQLRGRSLGGCVCDLCWGRRPRAGRAGEDRELSLAVHVGCRCGDDYMNQTPSTIRNDATATDTSAATSHGPVRGSVNLSSIEAKRLASRCRRPDSARLAALIAGSRCCSSDIEVRLLPRPAWGVEALHPAWNPARPFELPSARGFPTQPPTKRAFPRRSHHSW